MIFKNNYFKSRFFKKIENISSKKMIKLKLSRINNWKKKEYTIGVANGCFDMLHPGHKKLIKEAKKNSDKFIILLNSDQSIKKIKGKNRPIENIFIRKKK